jgi:hypothetical protein
MLLNCFLNNRYVFMTYALLLRPQLLSPPAGVCSRAIVEGIPESASLFWVAEIRHFHNVRHNDNETEVLARNRIVEIVRLGAELEILVVVRLLRRLSWRGVLERT